MESFELVGDILIKHWPRILSDEEMLTINDEVSGLRLSDITDKKALRRED